MYDIYQARWMWDDYDYTEECDLDNHAAFPVLFKRSEAGNWIMVAQFSSEEDFRSEVRAGLKRLPILERKDWLKNVDAGWKVRKVGK